MAWSSVRLLDANGAFAGILTVGADITQRIRAQDELHSTQHHLERVTRANLLGELASALAHELNQPLTAILSNAQAGRRFLAAETPDWDELRAILDDIVRDDKRAGEVIHRLRAMLKKGPIARERSNLNNLVREVLALLNSEFVTHNVTVRTELEAGLLPVRVGSVEIQQVLINLRMNSLQAMKDTPPGRRILEIQTASRNENITLAIRDCGPGIPEDRLPAIFDPFFTTKVSGLGMGLAICRRLVETYGGWMHARNHPGGGAEFSFTLPAASEKGTTET